VKASSYLVQFEYQIQTVKAVEISTTHLEILMGWIISVINVSGIAVDNQFSKMTPVSTEIVYTVVMNTEFLKDEIVHDTDPHFTLLFVILLQVNLFDEIVELFQSNLENFSGVCEDVQLLRFSLGQTPIQMFSNPFQRDQHSILLLNGVILPRTRVEIAHVEGDEFL
jgi:hypothetical protein